MIAYLFLCVTIAVTLARLTVADIWDDIGNAFSTGAEFVWDKVKSFVVRMIRNVAGWIMSSVGWLFDSITWIIAGVWSALVGAIQAVENALGWWVGILWAGIQNALSWASWLVNNVVGWVTSITDWLWSTFLNITNAIWQHIADVVSWVADNIFVPLWNAVTGIIAYIGTTFSHWIQELVNNVWCFVKDVAGSIGGIAQAVFDDAIGPFLGLLNVGLKAIEWLAWMAFHPLTWFGDLVGDFFKRSGDWLFGKVAQAVQDNMSTVDDWLSKFFG